MSNDLFYKNINIQLMLRNRGFYMRTSNPRNLDIIDSELLLDFVVSHNIENLYHFTPVENLYSIMVNGICPVQELCNRRISYRKPDSKRYDGRLSAISLSVSHPNTKLLFCKEAEMSDTIFCILEIDASVLFELDAAKEFFAKNAASMEYNGSFSRTNISFFQEMFSDNSAYPEDEQAEILFHGVIPVKYIKNIYFRFPLPFNETGLLFKKLYKYDISKFHSRNPDIISLF